MKPPANSYPTSEWSDMLSISVNVYFHLFSFSHYVAENYCCLFLYRRIVTTCWLRRIFVFFCKRLQLLRGKFIKMTHKKDEGNLCLVIVRWVREIQTLFGLDPPIWEKNRTIAGRNIMDKPFYRYSQHFIYKIFNTNRKLSSLAGASLSDALIFHELNFVFLSLKID